jgi:hypothetical protein
LTTELKLIREYLTEPADFSTPEFDKIFDAISNGEGLDHQQANRLLTTVLDYGKKFGYAIAYLDIYERRTG